MGNGSGVDQLNSCGEFCAAGGKMETMGSASNPLPGVVVSLSKQRYAGLLVEG